LPQNGGKFGYFYIETIPEAMGFLNSSIEQIRKPIPAKVMKRNEKIVAYFKQFER
jgi:hypothetical protein